MFATAAPAAIAINTTCFCDNLFSVMAAKVGVEAFAYRKYVCF